PNGSLASTIGLSLQRNPSHDGNLTQPTNEAHQWQHVSQRRGKKLDNVEPSAKQEHEYDQPMQQFTMDNSIEEAIKRLSNLPLQDIDREKTSSFQGNSRIHFRHVLAKARRGVKLSPQSALPKEKKHDNKSLAKIGDDPSLDDSSGNSTLDVHFLLNGNHIVT
ncbi:hypothetical protein SLA2020_428740, partial [Shorea laevis]